MNKISDLLNNYVLNVAIISWLLAQIIKTIINFATTKKLNLERLVGAGGMPSAHSASVCGMTIAVARSVGFQSPLFAMAFLFASVVMFDAMGVRRAAGEHAKIINMIVKRSKENNENINYSSKNKDFLKEFLGHTPLEVMGGAMLGILVAMMLPTN